MTTGTIAEIIPDSGMYCAVTIGHGPADRTVKHYAFDTRTAMLLGCEALIKEQERDKTELYLAFSSFLAVPKGGPNKGYRTQANTRFVKTLVLDVDIRPGIESHHDTYEAAFAETNALAEVLELPAPMIVDSGAGLHVYFLFEADVVKAKWVTYAKAFRRLTRDLYPKLVADSTRVADSAGLLRMPGSWSFKREKPVILLQPHGGRAQLRQLDVLAQRHEAVSLGVQQSEDRDFERSDPTEFTELGELIKSCNWMLEYTANRGSASEPEWHAALQMSRFLTHKGATGAALAHRLSDGHAGYSAEATDRKYARAVAVGAGPPLCRRLETLAPTRCQSCPLRNMISTPLQAVIVGAPLPDPVFTQALPLRAEIVMSDDPLGGRTVVIQLPAVPEPYVRTSTGKVAMMVGGELKVISDYDMYPIRRLRDEVTDAEIVEVAVTFPIDGQRTLRVPAGLLADARRFANWMSERGVYESPMNLERLALYLGKYSKKLQSELAAETLYAQLGWRDLSTKPKFVLADEVLRPNALSIPVGTPSEAVQNVRDFASKAGDLATWRRAYMQVQGLANAPPMAFVALLAWAAPLMVFTGYHGVLVNLVGASGRGKSTSMKVCASVWGQPKESMIQIMDNKIPMLNKLGVMNSLPVTFDEITEMDPAMLGVFLYELANGRGKERAHISGITKANSTTWNTILIGSSNVSLYSKIAANRVGNNAQNYRVLEFNIDAAKDSDKPVVDEMLATLAENYGIAGRDYAQYLVDNVDAVQRMVEAQIRTFDSQFGIRPAERFWSATCCAVLVGATIAKEIGLHFYDVKEIVRWAVKQIDNIRFVVAESLSTPSAVLGDFLNENIGHTVKINAESKMEFMAERVFDIRVRYDISNQHTVRILVSKKALRDYCYKSKVEYGWLVSELNNSGHVTAHVLARLLSGTGFTSPPTACLELNLEMIAALAETAGMPPPDPETPQKVRAKPKELH